MAKVSFSKLGLKKNTAVKSIKIGEQEIEVKQYLPMEEKLGLVEIVSDLALEFNFINPLKIEKYFNLFFVYLYTNISFTDKQKEDEDALYDILESNGVIDAVIQASYEDYVFLFEKCEEYMERLQLQRNSVYGMLSQIVNDIPEALSNTAKTLSELDYEKISDTIKAVSEIGGNEDAIKTYLAGQK